MVSLTPIEAALAPGNPGDLLFFPVKLLNFPTPAIRLLNALKGRLSHIVSDDIVRPFGRERYPEQLHFRVKRKLMNLDGFTGLFFSWVPLQAGNGLIRLFSSTLIHLSVRFERAAEQLSLSNKADHQLGCCLPGVYQSRLADNAPVPG